MYEESRDRIFAEADLYEQANGKGPSIDMARKLAKVNMKYACLAMQEWRKARSCEKFESSPVPEALQKTLQSVWTHAQQIATESLRAAQSTFDALRVELETDIQEVSEAYGILEQELTEKKIVIKIWKSK
jgi:colicin import membrane protein